MRFNKSRGWTLFGHTSPETNSVRQSDTMPEEVEVIDSAECKETPEPRAAEPEPASRRMSADPINNLSGAVNRLQRLLGQARFTSNGPEWVEKYMNELATGIEIAIECDLVPMQDALIDTARILHSYDRQGRWNESLPFLNNSYGLLSIMVGDVIVDKIQSSLVRKWKTLYQKAVEELEKVGIPLARDDEEEEVYEEEKNAPVGKTVTPGEEKEPGPPRESFSEAGPVSGADQRDEEFPSVKGRASTPPRRKSGAAHSDIPPLSLDSEDEEYGEEEAISNSIIAFPKAAAENNTSTDSDTGKEVEADLDTEDVSDEFETGEDLDELLEESEPERGPVEDDGVGDDLLFEDTSEPEVKIEEEEDFDEEEEEQQAAFVVEDKDPQEQLSQNIPVEEARGVHEADTAGKASFEENLPSQRCDENLSYIEETVPDVPSGAPAEAPVVPEGAPEARTTSALQMPADKETPETLLHRAREAMSKGAVHDAKSAALGLALAMAQIELDQAEAAVAAAEQRLVENAQSIRNAQDAVDLAARNLLQTEELLATRDGECGACREHITALDDNLAQFEAELKDIDAQIEALQQRRSEQVNRIGNKQLEKEDVLNNESRLQTEIEALKQEVEGMHQHLDELQLDARDKTDSKSAIEMDICLAREEAETRRAALESIKRTLNPATDVPEEASPGNGYLL